MTINLNTFRLVEAEAELRGLSDRAAAIVGGSLIETELKQLLIRARVKAPGKFDGKIKSANRLRLLPPGACTDADLIRKIRNEFAHTHQPLSFETPRIESLLSRLNALSAIRAQLTEFKKDPERWASIQAKGWHHTQFLFFVAISSIQGTLAALANSISQEGSHR